MDRIPCQGDAKLGEEVKPAVRDGEEVAGERARGAEGTGRERAHCSPNQRHEKICAITAVPYCVWDNRKAGQMLVWLRESG